MPSPVNQWYVPLSGAEMGFGPLRRYRPLRLNGNEPVTWRLVIVSSFNTGALFPMRYGFLDVMFAPEIVSGAFIPDY